MMRGPTRVAVAVRKPDGSIAIKVENRPSAASKYALARLPIIRGVVSLYESLVLGIGALLYSAEVSAGEEINKRDELFALLLAVAVAVGLFMVLPTIVASAIARALVAKPWLMNLLEGMTRMVVLLLYVASISKMQDIRRVLEYHGAEHKAVHTQEAGLPLEVDNGRKFSTLHPRCGTSFLLFTVLVSILLFSFFGWPNLIARVCTRITLLPLVAGVSYEFIRLAGESANPVVRALSWPGLFLQRMTTREPDDSQLVVAFEALKAVLVPASSGGEGSCES
ncbi:MAG TPA: DUF1385 domain-containing protein [Firmicutes bacterium]|nr:DUF1385 domain-containing protein [Bacillota bacterium]